jgi:hypothetical protein
VPLLFACCCSLGIGLPDHREQEEVIDAQIQIWNHISTRAVSLKRRPVSCVPALPSRADLKSEYHYYMFTYAFQTVLVLVKRNKPMGTASQLSTLPRATKSAPHYSAWWGHQRKGGQRGMRVLCHGTPIKRLPTDCPKSHSSW